MPKPRVSRSPRDSNQQASGKPGAVPGARALWERALLHKDANLSGQALARCLGDVLTRIPEGAPLNYLTDGQTRELMDWDAEKHRRAPNAR
jgi:hypothetical protein